MKINTKVTPSFKKMDKKFKKKPRKIDGAISKAIKKTAFLMEAEMKRQVTSGPNRALDTGRLRSSIFTSLSKTKATVMPKVNYAFYVHEGTSRMRKRPFITDAVLKVESKIPKIFKKQIFVVLKKP